MKLLSNDLNTVIADRLFLRPVSTLMAICLYYFLAFTPLTLYCQSFSSIAVLDTFINTNIMPAYYDLVKLPVVSTDGVKLWVYKQPLEKTDTLCFLSYDPRTRKIDSINLFIPNLDYKITGPELSDFAINETSIALHFKSKSIAYFNYDKDIRSWVLKWFIPFQMPVSKIGFLDSSQLILCNSADDVFFEEDAKNRQSNGIICNLSTMNQRINAIQKVPIKNIEFTHFLPNKLVDISRSKIAVSQTTDYRVSIYDNLGKTSTAIQRDVSDWVDFNDSLMSKYKRQIPRRQIKALLDSLAPYNRSVSRIENISLINDSCLIIRYTIGNSKQDWIPRGYDIWKYSNQIWALSHAGLLDAKPDPASVCTKENYPPFGAYTSYVFSSNLKYMLGVRLAPLPYQLGATYEENYENSKHEGKTPTYYIYQYNLTKF